MFKFAIDDLVYYVVNNQVEYGIVTVVNYTNNVATSYTLDGVEPPHSQTTVQANAAFPSGYGLIPTVTPTPSPSVGSSPSVTASSTITPTPTSSPQVAVNLFATTTTGWTTSNGTIALVGGNLQFTSSSSSSSQLPTFTRTFNLNANTVYKFSLRNLAQTCANATFLLSANSDVVYAIAPTAGATLINAKVSSSGTQMVEFNSQQANVLTLTVSLYADSNFKTPAGLSYTYDLADTYLGQDYYYVAPTPSPTPSISSSPGQVSPTPSPTISVSPSASGPVVSPSPSPTTSGPAVTPSPSPTISVSPSASGPAVSPTISVTPSITPSVSHSATPTPSVTPSVS